MDAKEHPTVFISYSHTDNVYEQKMLDFANRLRDDGIDASIDLFEDAPPEGWPRWMENQIANSDYVLVVCSESYWDKCYKNHAKGISWEVNIVYQNLYDQSCQTTKYIPVFWNKGDDQYILTPIKGFTYYNIGTEDGYQDLWKRLLGIKKHQKHELGEIDTHKYDPLPKKPRRTMFFVTPIDVDKWNKAKWRGVAYLIFEGPDVLPVLGFLFDNYSEAREIFKQWKEGYKSVQPDDYLKISLVVPPMPKDCYVYADPEKNYGKGYFVHLGMNDEKAIERAVSQGLSHEEIYITSISRYIWVDETNGNERRNQFLQAAKDAGGYTIIPMSMIDKRKGFTKENLIVGDEFGLDMKSIECKIGTNLKDDDQCKAVLQKPETCIPG